jgi:hypothetical protein
MDGPSAHDPGSIDDELSDGLRARVKAELEPGERLLWAARPFLRHEPLSGGFLAGVLIAIVLSVAGGLSFVKFFQDPLQQLKGLLTLGLMLGIGDVVLILGLVSSRLHKRYERARMAGTLYALTDRRAIIWTPESSSGAFKVVTIPRGAVSGVHRVQYPDGSGDVLFKAKGSVFQYDEEYWGPSGFLGVAEVRRVEEQVRRTLVDSPTPPDAI